jgi:long-chain acyl-CoA synthetase
MISRLFDIVRERSEQEGNAVMLAAKEHGQWRTYTATHVWETAKKLAGGLLSLGLTGGLDSPEALPKIAIISENRPEWLITDVGVQLAGCALTPIYPTVSPHDLAFILNEAEAQVLFISNQSIWERFQGAVSDLPLLKHIFSFDALPNTTHWQMLIDKNLSPDASIADAIRPETLATIIYTSGTTGNPKGVMLTHHNIVSNVLDCMPIFSFATKHGRALSFLPLNHVFERMVSYVYLNAGVGIYYAESMDTIAANLREVKPMVFTSVPRLLEKVYERIMATGLELSGIKRGLFFWSLALGKKFDNVHKGNIWYRAQLAIANKLVFNKWREALGGQVKAIVVGSAATQERLVRIFSAAKVIIMEGYGLTETSPVVSVNHFESENRRMGSVGPVIPNVEVKLAEDGEILCKGPNITIGYYKHPEMTAEAMPDGWFHTGDIGQWVDGRFLKITDRKKEIFKTSGGKYVAPQVIENKMKESPYIEQMMVIGNGRKFVSALIIPSFMQLRKYLPENFPALKLPEGNDALIAMPEVVALIQKQMDKYNPFFGHPEQVKKFALLADEWTVDGGELTPSLKIKRKVIEQKYAPLIASMYEG